LSPPTFGGIEYPHVVKLDIESLAPFRGGVELARLVPRLEATFPDPATWSVRMRRALVLLHTEDAELIAAELAKVAGPYADAARNYLLQ
jgi:hypothetical protein